MGAKDFVILYTKQTKKKHKVWHDGTLKFTSTNKGLLYDDKGIKLDSVFVKDDIQIGDQLESDHYLITIEEVLSSSTDRTNYNSNEVPTLPVTKASPKEQPLHMQGRSSLKPKVAGNCLRQNRVGLKRQRSSGFIPPLLKVPMQVNNQKEIPPFISNTLRESDKNKNQNSYPNPSMWNSFVTKQNMSNEASAPLNYENIKDNQIEKYSSKSWSLENSSMDIDRKSPVHSGIFQKTISRVSDSPTWLPVTNQFYINEDRTANLVGSKTLVNNGSFNFREKSTDLIPEDRIQSCGRIYTENNIQNLTCDSEINQYNKPFIHFDRKNATVNFSRDELVQDKDERFNINFSETINDCEKKENISELNPLIKVKNKRTASQVMALLKTSSSEISKNKESNTRNLPYSADVFLSKGKDSKSFKNHCNDVNDFDEKQQQDDFIDQELLETNINIVQLSKLCKKTDNELCSSKNDPQFPQTLPKDSDVKIIKSPSSVLDESPLDTGISSNLNFNIKNDDTSDRIDYITPNESIDDKYILFSSEGFKRSISMEELNGSLIRTDINFNKSISEKDLSVPIISLSTVHPEVSLDNITKNSLQALKPEKEVTFPLLEFNNKSEGKDFVAKKNTLAENHAPILLNINNEADYDKFQEPDSNIKNKFEKDLNLYKAAILSSPNNGLIKKEEENESTTGTNSIIQTDIMMKEYNKDNQSKRSLVSSTTEEPHSKRFRIEAERFKTDSVVNRDELYRVESYGRIANKKDDITENLSPKVSTLAKGSENVELPSENQTENVEEVSEDMMDEEVTENVLVEKISENMKVEEVSENVMAKEVSENVMAKEVSENVMAEEVSENVMAEEVSENVMAKEVSENVMAEEVSENVMAEEVSENVMAEEVSENVMAEEVSEIMMIEVSENVLVEKMSENVMVEEVSENILVDEVPENILVDEVSKNALIEEVFGLVQSKDNCHKSGISDSAHLSDNNFNPTANDESKLTNVNLSGFPQVSSDKSIPKLLFANKDNQSNCSQTKDNITEEKKYQNHIADQINTCTPSNTFSKNSLSNPVIHPILGSGEICWDNSSSEDGLNFDLSFDFDDNSQQANNKQIDQNAESEKSVIESIKSVSDFLNPQAQNEEKSITKAEKKNETMEIPKSISADDSSIGSNRNFNKQNISDSLHVKTSILDHLDPQLKEKNRHSDFNSHPITENKDEAKIVPFSSNCHLKDKNKISDKVNLQNNNPVNMTFDLLLSNKKETIQEYNQKESLPNHTCVKKDESVLDDPYKPLENSLSEPQIKHLDFGGSKMNSQGLDDICESKIQNPDNTKNINQEVQDSNVLYSSLDELSFSPDPFDKFESGLNQISCQNEIIPSLGPGISKSLSFTNILDSSVKTFDMSSFSRDKISISNKTDVDDVIFPQTSHVEKVQDKSEFSSVDSISDHTQNSVTLSTKPEVYRIGQLFPLTIDQNIPEKRIQRLPKHQDFEHQQRPILQTKLSLPRENYLPHPSRHKGNIGKSIPRMDLPKNSLLTQTSDLNGYRMHGSVFSDMVKRTKASSNTKVNSFKEATWDLQNFHNSTDSFSLQEKDNALYTEEFQIGLNSIEAKLAKRTGMDTYSSRKKTWGKDLYNDQNNETYYDFDPIVPSHNGIIYSPNTETDITVPSFPNNVADGKPNSPCFSPCCLSQEEFQNGFSENTFQEFSNEFPLSSHKAFPNPSFVSKKHEYYKGFGESSFEHYPKTEWGSQVNFNRKDSGKTFAFSELSDTEETKSHCLVFSNSPENLTLNLDLVNGNPNDSLHEINKIPRTLNNEVNKTIMKNIDLDIPPKMTSNNNDCLGEFINSTEPKNLEIQQILVSDNEESDSSDCQLISSSKSFKYKHRGINSDMKPFSSKSKTEPVKCKPFEDSVTHENYSLYYYSPKSHPGENNESENMETNTGNDFSDDEHLTLSQESICLGKEEQVYNSLNLDRKILINKNNGVSNQIESQRNERDWNFIKENHVITHCQQKIGSMQFADPDHGAVALFPESELRQTSYGFYKKSTPDNIREYDKPKENDDSILCSNSSSQSFDLLSQQEDQTSNEYERQDEDDRQLHNQDFKILDQIHNESQNSLNQKQTESFNPKCSQLNTKDNNSINSIAPNSYFSHSSSAHLKMVMHNSSSQFPQVAELFESSLLNQHSSMIQDQSPSLATTKFEILPDTLCSNKSSKKHKYEELKFPSQQDVAGNMVPKRRMVIPVTFQNVTEYKRILTSVLKEHLNIILFELSSNYHNSMTKADLSSYQQSSISNRYPLATGSQHQYPNCNCGLSSKMVQVRKEGKNKGRFFYTCASAKNHQCKFFQWADHFDQQAPRTSSSPLTPLRLQLPKLCDGNSINIYLRRYHIMFYCESVFVRQRPWEKKSRKYHQQYECEKQKNRLYIRLSFKDSSGCYSKDDLWIISKNLNFEPSLTFIARSVFYGPNSSSEIQIEPLAGYFPSNWNTDTVCHAILAGNVSTELSCLMNLQEHVTISSSPIISSLLHRKYMTTQWTRTMPGFKTPFQCHKLPKYSSHELASLAEKYVTFWKLNSGQAKALNNVASMLDSCESDNSPIILIHGVFGSGKSYLLAIIVLYLLDVIEVHQAMKSASYNIKDEKILISSTTNVAVDRILLYLLEFGCNEFIRVGSVRKIAKPILPFSVHATSTDNNDLKELQEMLKEENLSKIEKQYVRKSIEVHKLGLNKKKLHAVKVVGVTCASCSFSCLEKMKFSIVLLDECSQMTEPASLLPLARFGCEKLLLVGDPMQLDPTIQGSEAENEDGLEQSLFDRLLKMGHESVLLQRQYRCHPAISHIANTLFYGRQLEDGIKEKDRPKLVPELPTLCFYDVSDGKEICESSGSFYNTEETGFVISIILALLACGVEPTSIGVIALYKSQTYQINKKLLESWQTQENKFLKGKSMKSIQVSTVDAFQGGERDVIILSCVRTSHTGFVNNNKRMNVALTRARNHLFIIGKRSNLCTDETWSKVIQICQDSPNSFQSAKQAKIKLQDLCNHALMTEEVEEERKSIGTNKKEKKRNPQKWHCTDVVQEKSC